MEKRRRKRLTWQAGLPYYFAYQGNLLITVPIEVFHQHLANRLKEQGIEMKSWYQLMIEAEQAWKRQGTVEEELLTNLTYWIALDGQNVRVQQIPEENQ